MSRSTSTTEVVFINGKTIGYQFNKKSMGERKVRCKIHTSEDGTAYCFALGMKLKVRPIHPSARFHFEAVSQWLA